MASFDAFNYDIEDRLPEWWKGFGALEPINKRTQELIAEMLQGLLTSTGVVQPLNCWLTIPEEYNWYHHYKVNDPYLKSEQDDGTIVERANPVSFPTDKIIAVLPNTKRKCHAKIQLKLEGTDIERTEDENSEYRVIDTLEKNENVTSVTFTNGNQKLKVKDINSVSTIEILTETNQIIVNGKENPDLIEGSLGKIQPVIENLDYKKTYIHESGKKVTEDIDLEDENKKTELVIDIESDREINFDLQIYLLKPTYTTEQNIRVASVSAFPIEKIELHGYFCHQFNNKSGYKKVWEKTYTYESRTTYERITKQYDCERFYIKVFFYGISVPLEKGFPQLLGENNLAFLPNPVLDRWGKIYNLPRRYYKPDITEDEEPYTFPKYYPYDIEQDYWYEERIVNEYRYNDEAVNTLYVRDSNFKNIGILECIYPFMNNIWVYTETITPDENIEHELKDITPTVKQSLDKNDIGQPWGETQQLSPNNLMVTLKPKNDKTKENFSYRAKPLYLSFCLSEKEREVKKNIKIKGIELKLFTRTNVQSNQIKLDDSSQIIIPFISPSNSDEPILEPINIQNYDTVWMKEKDYYVIGGKNYLFEQSKITREQLFNGNNRKLDFKLIFTNKNSFIESTLFIDEIKLNIYYEEIKPSYDIETSFDKQIITLPNNNQEEIEECHMVIDITNKEKTLVNNKNIFIMNSPELNVTTHIEVQETDNYDYIKDGKYYIIDNHNNFTFNLDVNENISIDNIVIKPEEDIETGKYDILVVCEDKTIKNEIIVRREENESN